MTESYQLLPSDSGWVKFQGSGWVEIIDSHGLYITLPEDAARALLAILQRHFVLDSLANV